MTSVILCSNDKNTYVWQEFIDGAWVNKYPISNIGFPGFKLECDRAPECFRILDFKGFVVYPVTEFMAANMTLAEHAESWARENGKWIPDRNTELGKSKWDSLYMEWILFAFEGVTNERA